MNKLSFILILMSVCAFGDFTDLQGQKITPENENSLFYSSVPYAIARQGQRSIDSNSLVIGYSEIEDRIFSVSSDMEIVSTKKEDRTVINSWPLIGWQYHLNFTKRQSRIAEHSLNDPDFAPYTTTPLGCLNTTPLRYGDIENDGDKELVLILGNDLVVFSPDYQRTVFSANLRLQDWMNASDTEFIYTDEFGKVEKAETEPQYASALANTFRMIPGGPPGYRGYAKVFQGDFDKDGAFDLIVWQKVYESKLENDSQRGFALLHNRFFHYERDLNLQAESEEGITGEYLPQETTEATIQSWISENELTWSKGYPSISECEGEEGKLIPEMHDALLNDSEVLQ